MKLTDWAKLQGITYRTAWEHYRTGKIPSAYKIGSRTIIVPDSEKSLNIEDYTVVYARVSSSQNRENLITQSKRISDFCSAKGWVVQKIVEECASGLNDSRPKLLKLLKDPRVTRIVVEHKDRLTRFGFNYIKVLSNIDIVVINEVIEDEKDLMQDFVSLVTSFTARLYGRRRTKRNTERLINELAQDKNDTH